MPPENLPVPRQENIDPRTTESIVPLVKTPEGKMEKNVKEANKIMEGIAQGLKDYFEQRPDALKTIGVDKLMAKAKDIFQRETESKGIRFTPEQQVVVDGMFTELRGVLEKHSEGPKITTDRVPGTPDVKPFVKPGIELTPKMKDPVVVPGPSAPRPTMQDAPKDDLGAAVDKEKNTIVPRDDSGKPSSNPAYSFDAKAIPQTLKITLTNGTVLTGETPKGRNDIAQFNVIHSMREAAIRAEILKNTGKTVEQLADTTGLGGREAMDKRSDATFARLKAETNLKRWSPDSATVERYTKHE